ncbi:hypothetical protein ACHAPQ_011803 [Fusarium lateritium]
MSVIAKRTVSPSSGPWRDAFTVGELTIAVDLDIKGEKRAMGIKVTITLLNNEKGGTTLAGIRLELEASMQVLIPKDKFSVFTMDFIWTKGTGEFSGECEFSGIGNNLPFGIPTEITEANLYVSNTNLRVSGRLEALIGKPTEMVVILDPSKIPSLQIDLTAELHKENTPAGKVSKEFILGDAVQKLLGQEGLDILPDFVIGTTFRASESGKDKFDIVVTRLNGTKLRLVFGAELKFGMLYVQFA